VVIVPLDGHHAPEPAGRRRIVGAGDFDAAVEVDGARAVLVVPKRLDGQRLQLRLLLGEHGGDLALGRAVDAGIRETLARLDVLLHRVEGRVAPRERLPGVREQVVEGDLRDAARVRLRDRQGGFGVDAGPRLRATPRIQLRKLEPVDRD